MDNEGNADRMRGVLFMAPRKREPAMVEQLREAIRSSGQTLNQLSRVCDVDPSRLSRFLRGERTITVDAAGRICEALGITLNIPPTTTQTVELPEPEPLPRPLGKRK